MSTRPTRSEELELDLQRYELRRGDAVLRLEKIPMELMILLVEHKDRLVSREEIIERLWGKGVFLDTEQGINTAIRKIRQVLHDDPERPRFVQTVFGKGYRFVAPILVTHNGLQSRTATETRVAPPEADPEDRLPSANKILAGPQRLASPGDATEAVPASKVRLLPAVATSGIAFLCALALLFALDVGKLRTRLLGRAVPVRIQSVAVLPLENLSHEPEQEYFADGMTEELIKSLGKIGALHVTSRTSVMRYKRTDKSLPQVARELNVDGIVEGTVQRSGDRVRITAQLIHAPTDHRLWAESYDRELKDVLALQEDVARAIANEIKVTLTPEEQMSLAAVRPVNPEAYEAYLKGRYYSNKRTEKELRKSIECFQQAINKDPNYASAYSGMAEAYALLGERGNLPSNEALSKGKAAALKAVGLDDSLAEAHASLAIIAETLEWDWPTAEREYKRALKLNPGYAAGHHWYAGYLMYLGRFDEGIAEEKRARELDPLSLAINNALGGRLLTAGRENEAIEQIQKTLEMDPNFAPAHTSLGYAYLSKGMNEEAIAEFQKGVALSGSDPDESVDLGFAFAVTGKKDEAKRILAKLKRKRERSFVSPAALGIVSGALGEKDEAFAWLEKAYEVRDPTLTYLKVGPKYTPLRSDPRFQDLLRRMGLPP